MGRSFVGFVREQRTALPIVPTTEDCQGKTFIITGSNVGLGYECAKHLIELSAKRVILAVRSLEKGETAKESLEAATGRHGVAEVWHLDLASSVSVTAFADRAMELDRLDALIQNAGVAMAKYEDADGLESTLTVNVVNTMLLAALILPKLQACAKQFGTTPHLAIVGSEVAFDPVGVLEKLDATGDILSLVDQSPITMNRYPVSKLLLFYAFQEFASQHPVSQTGVVIDYVNPGLCTTELSRNAGFLVGAMIATMRFFLARTAEVGSRTELHAIFGGKECHGKYLSVCKVKEESVPDWIINESGRGMQKRAWTSVSHRLNKVRPGSV